jgi:C4-dicarboxylate-specific signal transduction histidine kinase
MRIRKKLIFLHTVFSLLLAAILAASVWPAAIMLVRQTETEQARLALKLAQRELVIRGEHESPRAIIAELSAQMPTGVSVGIEDPLLPIDQRLRDVAQEGDIWMGVGDDGFMTAFAKPPGASEGTRETLVARARLEASRSAVTRLLVILIISLLGMYALIAVSVEVFVLPRHVYGPIRRILLADRAVQRNQRPDEIIPEAAMPADEIGEIMRSRNATVEALRRHEADLAAALSKLEATAADLARKNHLLQTAQRNLADADRLASLGIMSAGLAHELNTPLAVIKGLGEKLHHEGRLDHADTALLLRVTARLERLSESLLDFARVRPPATARAGVQELVDEAWTLVKLDRAVGGRVAFDNRVPPGLWVVCDPDRLIQVFVNLLRNAADAMIETPRDHASGGGATITVRAERAERAERAGREGRPWIWITVEDEGPGLKPEIIERLFQPFASTRLDSRGTGLGLAVSEGIVKQHGGLLIAKNREDGRGAVFEVMLPG